MSKALEVAAGLRVLIERDFLAPSNSPQCFVSLHTVPHT